MFQPITKNTLWSLQTYLSCSVNRRKSRLRSVLVGQHLCGSALLAVGAKGGFISCNTSATYQWCVQLGGFILTGRQGSGFPVDGAGFVGGGWGVYGAQLDGRRVRESVITRLHLKSNCPHPHQRPFLTTSGLMGNVGLRSPADDTAGCKESHGYE